MVIERSSQGQEALEQRHTRRQNQGKVAKFYNHSRLFSMDALGLHTNCFM
jgi:hypothetical protein